MHDRDKPLANQCPNFVEHTFFQSLQVYTICSANRRINCGNARTKLWCQLWQQRKKMPCYISSNNDSVHWISHWFPLNKPLVQLQQSHIPATIIYETFRKGIVLTPACTNQSEMLDMQVFLFLFLNVTTLTTGTIRTMKISICLKRFTVETNMISVSSQEYQWYVNDYFTSSVLSKRQVSSSTFLMQIDIIRNIGMRDPASQQWTGSDSKKCA